MTDDDGQWSVNGQFASFLISTWSLVAEPLVITTSRHQIWEVQRQQPSKAQLLK
jgi:hypothetical protein